MGTQNRSSRGREARGVRNGGTGHKADGGFPGKVEQVEQPVLYHLLKSRHCRRWKMVASILAPCADKQIGHHGAQVGGAHHPAEKARAADGHQAVIAFADQLIQHRARIRSLVRDRLAQPLQHLTITGRRFVGAPVQRLAVRQYVFGELGEMFRCILHDDLHSAAQTRPELMEIARAVDVADRGR